MMEKSGGEIVIVGAGIAGLSTALALHRLGLKSIVLESASNLRASGFAIFITANAWRALDALGVGNHLRNRHVSLEQLQNASTVSGVVTSTMPLLTDKGKEYAVRCLMRKALLETLANELPEGTVRYSSKVVHIEASKHFKLVHLVDGSIIKAKVLIGCDGVNSLVAKWLNLQEPFHTGRGAVRGMLEFPNGHGLANEMCRYYGNGIRHGYSPCNEKYLYWFMTYFSTEEMAKEMHENPTKVKEFVLNNLGNVSTLSRTIVEKTELDNINVSTLKMRWPWDLYLKNTSKGNVCVTGDALHPMTPELGQGGCIALEDSVILARCLGDALNKSVDGKPSKDEEDEYQRIEEGLGKFAKERRWRSFMLITIAYFVGKMQQSGGGLVNFLRDKVLSGILINAQLKITDFDCGNIHHI